MVDLQRFNFFSSETSQLFHNIPHLSDILSLTSPYPPLILHNANILLFLLMSLFFPFFASCCLSFSTFGFSFYFSAQFSIPPSLLPVLPTQSFTPSSPHYFPLFLHPPFSLSPFPPSPLSHSSPFPPSPFFPFPSSCSPYLPSHTINPINGFIS